MPPKKLIEVAMPLEAINAASAREKSIRHGHPSTLHLWWARRPLAAARAVIFASLVDAPSSHPELFPTEEDQRRERERLFAIIEELVQWENSNNQAVLAKAKAEIAKWTGGHPPELLDPFAGGGAIPLEAQRLGLVAHARDLNPVAVLINKAMIELPPKFAGRKPVNPEAKSLVDEWPGASGLAEDVRHYGQWMKERAFERIGHLYPKVKDAQGQPRTVIAWLWARTVKCPNPVCGCQMPLAASFVLSKKKGHEAYVQPVVKGKRVSFEVHEGKDAPDPPKQSRGANFECVACGGLAGPGYIKAEAQAGRMGAQLMAVVAEGDGGRVYLAADNKQVGAADVPKPDDVPSQKLAEDPRNIWCPSYGLDSFDKLFTNRQLTALTTFSDLVMEAREQIVADGGSEEYANAVTLYLAFVVDKMADYNSSACSWHSGRIIIRNTFSRQAIQMKWDYAEANPFCTSTGSYDNMLEWVVKCVNELPASGHCDVVQHKAQTGNGLRDVMVATDPPYYDNIGYSDLSDYFYIWLRRTLKDVYPGLFATILTPKADEMIATPYRHEGSLEKARAFFEGNMLQAFRQIHEYARDDVPTTVFYAYKQSENDDSGTASTGWETMLTALINAGFSITGTWPMRTELTTGLKGEINALASSIVLVCRKRPADALGCSLRDFEGALRRELRPALEKLQKANIAPVDMAQSAIGPGMAVYSRYRDILKRDGAAVTVREALKIINKELDSILSQREEGLDDATRFCLDLYTQARYDSVKYDDALKLARGRNVTLDALDGLCVEARRGHVRLLRPDEVPAKPDDRMVWLLTQQLARAMDTGGVLASAQVAAATRPEAASQAKDLAYRLYSLAEKKGWGQDAAAYNNLVTNWGRVAGQAETLAASRREKDKDLIDQIEERPEQ